MSLCCSVLLIGSFLFVGLVKCLSYCSGPLTDPLYIVRLVKCLCCSSVGLTGLFHFVRFVKCPQVEIPGGHQDPTRDWLDPANPSWDIHGIARVIPSASGIEAGSHHPTRDLQGIPGIEAGSNLRSHLPVG